VQLGWHYVSDGLAGRHRHDRGVGDGGRLDRQMIDLDALRRTELSMRRRFQRRYLDLLGSIYIYNEHRGYTAIDRVLEAVRTRWPDDAELIAKIEKHRADERKHYLMFRAGSSGAASCRSRSTAPAAISTASSASCSARRSTTLDPDLIVNRSDLFERLCRVISLTEKRGHRQVEILLRHPIVRSDGG
jgi:hypothetical protein